jgi:hypothetical protein
MTKGKCTVTVDGKEKYKVATSKLSFQPTNIIVVQFGKFSNKENFKTFYNKLQTLKAEQLKSKIALEIKFDVGITVKIPKSIYDSSGGVNSNYGCYLNWLECEKMIWFEITKLNANYYDRFKLWTEDYIKHHLKNEMDHKWFGTEIMLVLKTKNFQPLNFTDHVPFFKMNRHLKSEKFECENDFSDSESTIHECNEEETVLFAK